VEIWKLSFRPSKPTDSACELPKLHGSNKAGKVFATARLRFFFKPGCKYKRIRRPSKGKPKPGYYELQVEKLKELEQLSMEGKTDLFYGDETHVCSEGYVPYGCSPMSAFAFLAKKLINSTVLDL
jgi:hypothetical protein